MALRTLKLGACARQSFVLGFRHLCRRSKQTHTFSSKTIPILSVLQKGDADHELFSLESRVTKHTIMRHNMLLKGMLLNSISMQNKVILDGKNPIDLKRIFYLPGSVSPAVYEFDLPPLVGKEVLDPLSRVDIFDIGQKIEISEPDDLYDKSMHLTRNLLKIRRKKMNKHKLRKRRRRDAAKRRAIFVIRDKKRAKKRAFLKKKLIEKLEKIRKQHPKSDIFTRPYVIHRLKNW